MKDTMPSGGRRTAALACVALAMVVDILDLTIVNVAVPSLRVRFGAGDAAVQWFVAGYAAIFATLLVTGGRLGDVFGYRRMLVSGLLAFTATSMLCGLAPDPTVLVVGRLLQGATAAMVVPQINAVVQRLYAPHERVAALALFGILGGAAAVAGPVIGGLVIGADLWGLGWRPIFFVNLPIGLGTAAAAMALLPPMRAGGRPRLDWAGTALVTLTMAAALVPLVQGREWGWPWWSFGLMALSLPLGIATVLHAGRVARRGGTPLLVLPLFREPSYAIGLALIAVFQSVFAAFLFSLTLMLQQGLGMDATRAGLAHIPFALGTSLAIGLIVRRLVPRFRTALVTAGAAVCVAGLVLTAAVALVSHAPGALEFAPGLFLAGLGMGTVVGPLAPIALSEISVDLAGAASGTLKAVQELGGALGVAALGALFFAVSADGVGPAIVDAFAVVALVLCALLATAGVAALRLPRDLRVFGARSDATIETGPSSPDGRSGASAR